MNDPMETEEVGLGYNYTPMAVGMFNTNISNYDFPPQPNFDFFNNQTEFEAEQRQRYNQFPTYYGNDSLIYSEPSMLSRIQLPKKIETKRRRVRAFDNWEDNLQPGTPPRASIPFQTLDQPSHHNLENNLMNNSLGNLIPSLGSDNKKPEPNLDHESDWYQDELWEGASQGSFEQNHNNANIESPLSSQVGEEMPSQLDLMVLNEISSIIDPLDKDLNDSETSEPCDREPFEKKRKIEDFVSKEKIDLPVETKPRKDWEHDIPGSIICAIKRGCRYYFTRCKGIRLESVVNVLDNKMIESQKKFEKFIVRYKRIYKTWQDITTYVSDEGDNEMAWLLMELISEFLASKEDVEMWLANTKISEKTKTKIRANKDILKESFILHFYPISQSWIKSVY